MLSSLIRPLLQRLDEIVGLLRENNNLMRELFVALEKRAPLTPRTGKTPPGPSKPKTGEDVFRVTRSEIAEQQQKERAKAQGLS